MRRLADGDREAFGPAYELLWPLLLAFCRRMLRTDDAEDAAQQALLKIFGSASAIDPRRDVVTWALSTAAWECRTIRKRYGRTRAVSLESAAAAVDDERTPEEHVIDADLQAALHDVLGTLTPVDRETLASNTAPTSRDAVTVTTLRKRRSRALGRLRDAWRRIHDERE